MSFGVQTCAARRWLAVALGVVLVFLGAGCAYYSLTPARFLTQLARVVATPVLAVLYATDVRDTEGLIRRYEIGTANRSSSDSTQTWHKLETIVPGFRLIGMTPDRTPHRAVSFVYETADAAYLTRFRKVYALDGVVRDAPRQYEAMLKLGAWVGTRWDHGSDPLVGARNACNPTGVVAAGERGAKYWCEIAARTTVHAASSLGWPARVITASRDGYTWEHAIAELWSDDFGKWFVMDTDFNVVYESNGIPLSAFELAHDGPALQRAGKLRIRRIAPPKPSLPLIDLMPFYRYVHVDLRNDWCSRSLRPGSPAGGDLATWWTARADMPPVLTAKPRVDDADSFNWALNTVAVSAVGAQRLSNGSLRLEVSLSVESPVFNRFETSLDGGVWEPVRGTIASWDLGDGNHAIAARMISAAGDASRATRVTFDIPP